MGKRLLSIAAAAVVIGTVSIAPAMAYTQSGTVNCGSGSTASVRGEQQLVSTVLTNKINGTTFFSGSGVYVKYSDSTYKNQRSWSVASETIVIAGSYGYCQPI